MKNTNQKFLEQYGKLKGNTSNLGFESALDWGKANERLGTLTHHQVKTIENLGHISYVLHSRYKESIAVSKETLAVLNEIVSLSYELTIRADGNDSKHHNRKGGSKR